MPRTKGGRGGKGSVLQQGIDNIRRAMERREAERREAVDGNTAPERGGAPANP